MLPLNSIPTEIIRKGFVPYRGFLTQMLIDLPPEDEPLRGHVGQRDRLSGAKEADLALSVTPIYQVFADLFGYDPALLQAGNGDCGVDGHDWNIYGRKDRIPQVIRWRGFDGGEALLCIGATHYSYHLAMVTGIANKAMSPHLARVFEAIGELANDQKKASTDLPAGDLLHKVITETQMSRWELTAGYWCSTEAGDPDEQQAAELKPDRISVFGYAHVPWFKKHQKMISDAELPGVNARYAQATTIERELGTRYTVDTLAKLVRRYPKRRFVWLMGADNLSQFHRWKDWRTIARTMPIAVIARPGYDAHAMTSPAMAWLRRHIVPAAGFRKRGQWSAPALVLLRFDPDHRSATAIRRAHAGWAEDTLGKDRKALVRDRLTFRKLSSREKA